MRPIVISCGEPAGIGPEVAVAAHKILGRDLPLLWIGDPAHLPPETDHHVAQHPEDMHPFKLTVLARDFGPPAVPGQPNPAHARHVIAAIDDAVALVRAGAARALCTAPIHKAALIDGANFAYPGHTEYLAALAGVDRVVMMLACDMLRVVPTTVHIPLAQVPTALTPQLLIDTTHITHAALQRDFGLSHPRIAVAGLNPHAGEAGKIGQEDLQIIAPAIKTLQAEGMQITGPQSADTLFHAAARAHYDVALCMYHDQALIPIKTLDFAGGVNVTLGLPFVRTSPDHGTALNIAGRGMADPTSMIAALRMAADMTTHRDR